MTPDCSWNTPLGLAIQVGLVLGGATLGLGFALTMFFLMFRPYLNRLYPPRQ